METMNAEKREMILYFIIGIVGFVLPWIINAKALSEASMLDGLAGAFGAKLPFLVYVATAYNGLPSMVFLMIGAIFLFVAVAGFVTLNDIKKRQPVAK